MLVRCPPIPRRPSGLRSLSFTSFFFNNAQWTRHPPLVHAPAIPLRAFRPADVLTPPRLLAVYTQLSKSRLSALVVLTAMSGVALSPMPATVPILLSTAAGTALCSASANALNQIQEVPFDAQMARTRTRPLVRRAITPFHAAGFALVTGVAGPAILWTMVNPTAAILGAGNIALYAGAYTWMKRKTTLNTWVGAIVGAIPPLIGWTACGGHLLPGPSYPDHLFLPPLLSSSPLDMSLINNPIAPFALFMLLFSWQFPHFNALSHIVRGSYAQAGYQMLSVLSPTKNALVSLRHSALLIAICSGLIPLSGLTTWTFALSSMVPNLVLLRGAWSFWKKGGEKQARTLFQHSLWYLPVMLALAMVHKQGMDWLQWMGIRDAPEKDGAENAPSP